MEIRRADAAEADVLAELWLRSRRAAVPAVPAAVHTDAEVHRWIEEAVFPSSEVWVADRGGQVVALMVLDGRWLDQLYVEPTSVGGGIGGAMLDVAKCLRPAGLSLWTFETNDRARRFYESHGFVATGGTAGDNEEQAPDVRYDWRPPASPR